MCQHENIGLSQDGSREIICFDCDRTFVTLANDETEGLIVKAAEGDHIAVVHPDGNRALGVIANSGGFMAAVFYPCRDCGWSNRCVSRGEECHP